MLTTTLYIATSNPGKLRDFAAAADLYVLRDRAITLPRTHSRHHPKTRPPSKATPASKALYYSRLAPGYDVLADDSGLEVDALNGDPGVRSARYAADAGFAPTGDADQDNNLLLLKIWRNSRIVSRAIGAVLALARDGEVVLTAEGAVEGRITTEPRGDGGFGYDPLFYLPELDKTMAEIDLATKSTLSHRGRALQALLKKLSAV